MAWRRLDEHGEERCAFLCTEAACIVEGIGAVAINGAGFIFEYRIEHDAAWTVNRAEVVSRLGGDEFRVMIERAGAGWEVDGVRAAQFDGCTDVDLAFSASTNTTALKRMALEVGGEGESRAILVEEPELTLTTLSQSYRRTGARSYDYRAGDYRVTLETDDEGVITVYPGRFEPALEPMGASAGPAGGGIGAV